MTLIDLIDSHAGYARQAVLDGMTLKISTGERIALVGESGVGKTTLLRLLYKELTQQQATRNSVAWVPQDLGLVPALSVFHNVYMGRLAEYGWWRNLRNFVRPSSNDLADVMAILENLRLQDQIRRAVGELSGGQQQRTAIGRALFHPGDVLIADEPVSNVDEHHGRELLSVLVKSKQTVIVAMHDRELAIDFATRVIGLKGGKIVMDATAGELSTADLDGLYR